MIEPESVRQFMNWKNSKVGESWILEVFKGMRAGYLYNHIFDLGLNRNYRKYNRSSLFWLVDKTKFLTTLKLHNPELYFKVVESNVKDL